MAYTKHDANQAELSADQRGEAEQAETRTRQHILAAATSRAGFARVDDEPKLDLPLTWLFPLREA